MQYFEFSDQINLEKENVIGIDETGVGDYFTPLISCAFYLPNQLKDWALSIGVKDSKKLTDKKVIEIGEKLKANRDVRFSVYRLKQSTYNEMSKNYNAHELKFFTHNGALNNLLKHEENANFTLLIDKYTTTNSILKYDQKILQWNNWANFKNFNFTTYLAHKAESIHLSVACASIMARYELIHFMQSQCRTWNFLFPLGSSKKTQEKVLEFQQRFGIEALNQVCKTSFKKTKG